MAADTINGDESWITKALSENPPPDSLPSGWIVRSSRSQPSSFFYYNQETGEARWEKPVEAKLASDGIVPVAPQPVAATEAANTQDRSGVQTTSKAATTTATKRSVMEAPAATSIPPEQQHAAKRPKQSSSGEPKEVRVLHILKKHKGSRRPSSWRNPNITSTPEEAQAELQGLVEVLQEVKDNPEEMRATFEELARTESDCSSAKRGGDLGFFGRKKMQPSFEQASFGLAVGEMSDVVESASGMHVILRVG
jgi:peptidyl-prolyl cis-trans isomerase NIMA-interacting 1